ncbi:MAG: hypothetical protein ABIV94_02485 [Acidimicrobiales bacterium]
MVRRRSFLAGVAMAIVVLAACGGEHVPAASPSTDEAPSATTTSTDPPTTVATTSTTSTTTTTPPPPPVPAPPPPPPGDGSTVLMIGDSVMLGAAPNLSELAGWSVSVDASISRQFGGSYADTGVQAVEAHAADATLPSRVVVHLGTNGPIRQSDLDQMMALLGDRHVVFVTVHVPDHPDIEGVVGDLLAANQARYPNIAVADWQGLAAGNPAWFAGDPDRVHPDAAGRQAYANLIGGLL